MSDVRLWHGDCLQLMGDIPSGSVDMVLCDLPYGTTACKWDVVIPFAPLWEHYKRVIKRNGAIVLFGSQPFTSALVMSNPQMFRYEWVWDKYTPTGFMNAKRIPMKQHENILVFYSAQPTYHPQKYRKPYKGARTGEGFTKKGSLTFKGEELYRPGLVHGDGVRSDYAYPKTIIEFRTGNGYAKRDNVHPTQKPVALGEYLIRTYTNEGETVLDNCMGSGSFGVSAVNTDRSFIGIEKYPLLDRPVDPRTNPNYFQIAQERIQAAQNAARQLPLAV